MKIRCPKLLLEIPHTPHGRFEDQDECPGYRQEIVSEALLTALDATRGDLNATEVPDMPSDEDSRS